MHQLEAETSNTLAPYSEYNYVLLWAQLRIPLSTIICLRAQLRVLLGEEISKNPQDNVYPDLEFEIEQRLISKLMLIC